MGSQKTTSNGYKVRARVSKDCQNCLLILKQSFHPNWQVRLNGQAVRTFPVFPFYIGIPLEKAGNYEVRAEYKPGSLKVALVWLEILVGGFFLVRFRKSIFKFF